ncbi:hypothetical protein OESDEN_03707 [Oesophagostomum dentatum]|uniref:Uncharacterized protein n=1 Tax=Oesophagostomum dentatum TaxID=61180 RepID=A0A0B1TKI0_OESDE|nr:hypothetical protein OESDEN_03707 [Oesophagostomum dentatum]
MKEKARQHVQSCADIHSDLSSQIHDLISAEAGIPPEPAETAHPPRRHESAALHAFDWKAVGKSRKSREVGDQRRTLVETVPELRRKAQGKKPAEGNRKRPRRRHTGQMKRSGDRSYPGRHMLRT